MGPNALGIILSDRMPLFREALRELIQGQSKGHVLGQAGKLSALLDLVKQGKPRLVITDWILEDGGALELLEHLHGQPDAPKVIVLTMVRDAEAAGAAFASGACGYILKEASREEFFNALDVVAGGGKYIDPRLSGHLNEIESSGVNPTMKGLAALTSREREILGEICRGHTSRHIAQHLNISLRTVETHRANIRAKLHLRTVADLTAFALANDLCRR